MKSVFGVFSILLFFLLTSQPLFAQNRGIINTTLSPSAKLRSIDIDDVKWTDGFWADKFELMHTVGVRNMWELLSDPDIGHAFQNFEIAAGLRRGEFKGMYWHDGDFYKWLEATSYVYALTKDPELKSLMDKAVDVIAQAQRDDGYLHTAIQIGRGMYGTRRFEVESVPFQERIHHEDYNFGHLMTAACIYYRATGSDRLLDVAKKAGDFLYRSFQPQPEKLSTWGWNPSHIMGLVELYRTTKNPKYLELAQWCVDYRGTVPGGSDWNQYRIPLRKETEAVGHVVTGNYFWAGAADVYLETGDKELFDVLDTLWRNITYQKMAVTGANGPFHRTVSSRGDVVGEAYGREYQLPNVTAYNETCGNIANAMLNWRLLAATGEARFADVMELIVYNSALSAISSDAKHFFYTNPLGFHEGHPHNTKDGGERQTYIACFCCPPSIVRTIAKAGGWAYSLSDNGVWVNFYGGNELRTELPDGSEIHLVQETDYPWDGKIKITVGSPAKKEYDLMVRIPGWVTARASCAINGRPVDQELQPGTYARLSRLWKKGDVVDIVLPMSVELIESNPLVEETSNQVAVKRGPIVYCLEGRDLPRGVGPLDVLVPADSRFTATPKSGGYGDVVVLKGQVLKREKVDWSGKLYRERPPVELSPVDIELIPYFAWANRGKTDMTVWLPVVRE